MTFDPRAGHDRHHPKLDRPALAFWATSEPSARPARPSAGNVSSDTRAGKRGGRGRTLRPLEMFTREFA